MYTDTVDGLSASLHIVIGLLISAICSTEVAAIEISLASFYPILLLSGEFNKYHRSGLALKLAFVCCTAGIIWPLEGMPVWLRYIAYAMPTTFGAQALRSIMARGKTALIPLHQLLKV